MRHSFIARIQNGYSKFRPNQDLNGVVVFEQEKKRFSKERIDESSIMEQSNRFTFLIHYDGPNAGSVVWVLLPTLTTWVRFPGEFQSHFLFNGN